MLASIYRDWCALVWDEVHDDSPECWLSAAEVNPFHVGQLLGPNVELCKELEDSLDEALNILMQREHKAVVDVNATKAVQKRSPVRSEESRRDSHPPRDRGVHLDPAARRECAAAVNRAAFRDPPVRGR